MKEFRWSDQKNEELKATRYISFEELLSSRLIGIENHPRKNHQWYLLFEFDKYVWAVPFVEDEQHFFLKTAFPSRKYTKKYLGGTTNEEEESNS